MAKSYAITPDESDLASIERDLSFHTADPTAASTLSAEQVEGFNKDGYVKNLRVYDGSEIASIRDYFDDLLERVVAEGGNSYSISSAHLSYGPVWDILTNPRICDLVSDLVGTNVVGWGSHFFCKMPGDGKSVAWHQDASYWPLSPTKAVTVWLAIDDADTENGCMRFIAGSHHNGHLTYRPSGSHEDNVLNQTIDNPQQYGHGEVDDELKAGECSIHSDLLLHGSDPNGSDRRRCGLTLRYAASDVQAHLGWGEKGVVVRGERLWDGWSDQPRPDGK